MVTISRAMVALEFPSRFLLVRVMHPCPRCTHANEMMTPAPPGYCSGSFSTFGDWC